MDKNTLILIITIGVLLVAPVILSTEYLVHMGCVVGINIILALGLNLVTGNSGQINMGQYGFYAVGAYTAGLVSTNTGLDFWPTLILVILVSALFGLVVGFPALKVEGPYLAVCTIAFAECVRIIMNNWDFAGQAMGIPNIPSFTLFGRGITTKIGSYYFIMGFVIVLMIIVFNLTKSNIGRKLLSVKNDSLAAAVMGVNVRNVKLLAFVICSIFAGIAGCLYANYTGYVCPNIFLQTLQTNFLLMIVLGGLGDEWGSVIGAVLVTTIYELTRVYVQYQMTAFGIVMILVVMFLKQGITGTIKKNMQAKMIVQQHESLKR
jgi:branched-chain amino acid transport system permease protein